jgi:hypothetical protein
MTCNQVVKIIPQVLRSEADPKVRPEVITHVQHCTECRTLYYQYQNMFYSIDRNIVLPQNQIDAHSFTEDVKKRISSEKAAVHGNRLYFIYAAAAVFLVIAVIYSFSGRIFTSAPEVPHKGSVSLTEYLEFENWKNLNTILNDPQKMKQHLDEKIPLDLLRDKLIDLQNRGIYSISYIDPSASNGNSKSEIPLHILLRALDRYRQGNVASIRDLSKLGIIT